MWRIRKQIPYNRRARNFLRTFLLLLLPHPAIRSTPAEIPGPLSSLSVLALPLAGALAVFALRIVESGAFAARRDRIEYKSFVSEVSVRRLSFVDFLWYRVSFVGISSCFATITGLRTDPCLYRSLCFSCVVPKWRHFSSLFSVKLFLLLPPLRPLPDFLVPRFAGFKSFLLQTEREHGVR